MIRRVELSSKVSHWGYTGERNAVTLFLPIADLIAAWADGIPSCSFRRADGREYAHTIERVNDTLEVKLSDGDTEKEGVCQLTINWSVGNDVAKTMIYMGRINASVNSNGVPPTPPEQGFIEQVNKAAADAIEAKNAILNMTADAIVGDQVGTPTVTVTKTTEEGHEKLSFAFDGLKGRDGEKGADGAKGEKGEKGDKGDKGEKGDRGLQGIQGVQGVPGATGAKGDKGDTGAPGQPGRDGSDASVTASNIKSALGYTPADEKDVKSVKEDYLALQESKITKPETAPVVGKVLKVKAVNEDGTFVCEWADDGSADAVTDVQVAGTSVVADGVANIPYGSGSRKGLMQAVSSYGMETYGDGNLGCARLTKQQYDRRVCYDIRPITLGGFDGFVRQSLTHGVNKVQDVNGTTGFSGFVDRQWTDAEKAASRELQGIHTMTQEEYDLITPVESDIYIIVGADV